MLDFVVLSKIEFKSTEYIQEEKTFLVFRRVLQFVGILVSELSRRLRENT